MNESQLVWYFNPAWYAIVLSLLSLIVAFLAFRRTVRKGKSETYIGLVTQSNEINEALARHVVKGPFAHKLRISDDELRSFSGKATVLFKHINLLNYVHQHRDVLGEEAISHWTVWGKDIVQPWVEADEHLKKIWTLECESRQKTDPEFINWLKDLVPIHSA
jgi:hypothetical protein